MRMLRLDHKVLSNIYPLEHAFRRHWRTLFPSHSRWRCETFVKVGTLAPPYAPGRQTQQSEASGRRVGERRERREGGFSNDIHDPCHFHAFNYHSPARSRRTPSLPLKLSSSSMRSPPASRSNDKCGNNTLNCTFDEVCNGGGDPLLIRGEVA